MEEFTAWQFEQTKNDRVFNYRDKFIEHFGDEPLSKLTREAAAGWIEALIAKEYQFNTIRLHVMHASRMFSWLDEESGNWDKKNPFRGLLKRYKNRFPAVETQGLLLSDVEIEAILDAAREKGYKAAELYIWIAYHTGLRPSEIVGDDKLKYLGIDARRINYTEQTWLFLVTKTQGRKFYRKIPIPHSLAVYIANCEEMPDVFPYNKWQVRWQLEQLREITGLHFTMKYFRKHFAHTMENAGAAPEIINLMQGRGQHGVLFEHYLTDPNRAARLCRPYVDAMFGERGKMVRVK